jgi:hypothetical protein
VGSAASGTPRGGSTSPMSAARPVLSRRPMRPVSCPRATYQRRQPEQTVLYRTIATHLPTFLARAAGEDGTGGWPRFVRREFEAYLRCGILENG